MTKLGMSVAKKRKQKSSGHLGIVVAARDGRIRYISTQARDCLQRYFGDSKTASKLPSVLYQWIKTATLGLAFLIEGENTQLDITLLEPKSRAGYCLVIDEFKPDRSKVSLENRLTPREKEVLLWLAEGKSNWGIGKILGLRSGTVRKHLQHIYAKLNVENRTAAARYARDVESDTARFGRWQQLKGFRVPADQIMKIKSGTGQRKAS